MKKTKTLIGKSIDTDKNLIDEAFAKMEKSSADARCLKEELLFFYAMYIKTGKVKTAYPRVLDNQYLLTCVCMLSYLRNKNKDENLFAIFTQWHQRQYTNIFHPIYIYPSSLTQYRAYWNNDESDRFNFENMNLNLSNYSIHKIALMIKESKILAKYAEMVKESVYEILAGGFEIFYSPFSLNEDDIICCPEWVCHSWNKYFYHRV